MLVRRGPCVAPPVSMYVAFDKEQAETLREILESQLKLLRTESARADSHD
jgi:hypothetical protein